ncbi:MAG TPA: SPOR domain-containing protein [Bryobacteraceae bacterium]|jgi:cell division septation protein DedD|nr:SPOR domain-containing protein [Bryobacteraceae bacterium]
MSELVDFSLSKRRLVWLILCSGLMLMLLFGAGVAAGFLLSGHTPGEKELHQNRDSVERETSKRKDSKAASLKTTERSAPKLNNPASPSNSASSQAAAQGHLSVEAASFPQEGQASHLAALLQRDGYHPVSTGEDTTSAAPSYYVRLGPYSSWEQASRVATELERSYDLHTLVKPARIAD